MRPAVLEKQEAITNIGGGRERAELVRGRGVVVVNDADRHEHGDGEEREGQAACRSERSDSSEVQTRVFRTDFAFCMRLARVRWPNASDMAGTSA